MPQTFSRGFPLAHILFYTPTHTCPSKVVSNSVRCNNCSMNALFTENFLLFLAERRKKRGSYSRTGKTGKFSATRSFLTKVSPFSLIVVGGMVADLFLVKSSVQQFNTLALNILFQSTFFCVCMNKRNGILVIYFVAILGTCYALKSMNQLHFSYFGKFK